MNIIPILLLSTWLLCYAIWLDLCYPRGGPFVRTLVDSVNLIGAKRGSSSGAFSENRSPVNFSSVEHLAKRLGVGETPLSST